MEDKVSPQQTEIETATKSASQPKVEETKQQSPVLAPLVRDKFKFITYRGNHSEFVAEALVRRGNFEQVERTEGKDGKESQELFPGLNLVWRPFQFRGSVLAEIDRVNLGRRFVGPLVPHS